MKNTFLILLTSLIGLSVFAQSSTDPQKPYVILACEPISASDQQYNLDVVVDGTTLKLIIHVSLFDQDRSEFFEVEAINRRSSSSTTIRAISAPALMLVVDKKGRLNAAGEPSFKGVFRGGGEYGVYRVECVKKEPPKPAPEKVKAPEVTTPVAPTPVVPTPETGASAPAPQASAPAKAASAP